MECNWTTLMTTSEDGEDVAEGGGYVRGTASDSLIIPGNESALLRAAVQAIGEAIIITGAEADPPGPVIQYVNPAFSKMTGYAPEEVLGRSPRILQGPKTDRAVLKDLGLALKAGRSFQGETVNYRRDGSEYIVEWLITPVLKDGQITQWVAAQRDVTEHRRSEEQRTLLAAEVNHRVYNTLATVEAVAAQTAPRAETAHEFKAAFRQRLGALVRVHRLLGRCQWTRVPLGDLAEAQMAVLTNGGTSRVQTEGPEIPLRPGAAVALGMALHELAANAVAYGALSVPHGRVLLRWTLESCAGEDRLRIRWSETGGPPILERPRASGFGSRLVERGLLHELRAQARFLFEPSGLRCEIDLPLDTVTGVAS